MKKGLIGISLVLFVVGCVEVPDTVTFMKPIAEAGTVEPNGPCGREQIRFAPQNLDWVMIRFAANLLTDPHSIMFSMGISKEPGHFNDFGPLTSDASRNLWYAKLHTLVGVRIAKPTIKFSWENGGHSEQEMAAYISLGENFDYANNFVVSGFSGDWLDVEMPSFALALDRPIPSVAAQKENVSFPHLRFTRASGTTLISIRCGSTAS